MGLESCDFKIHLSAISMIVLLGDITPTGYFRSVFLQKHTFPLWETREAEKVNAELKIPQQHSYSISSKSSLFPNSMPESCNLEALYLFISFVKQHRGMKLRILLMS